MRIMPSDQFDDCWPVVDTTELQATIESFEHAKTLKEQLEVASSLETLCSDAQGNAAELEKRLKEAYENTPTNIVDNLYAAVKKAIKQASGLNLDPDQIGPADRERLKNLSWNINRLLTALLPEPEKKE